MMEPSGPYRPSDPEARYVCIVCYRTLSTRTGSCARCGGVPLQRIDDSPDLIDELRQRARRKKARPARLQFVTTVLAAAVCAIVVDAILLTRGVYDVKVHAGYSGRWGSGGELFLYPFLMWLGFVIVLSYVLKWTGAFKRSMDASKKFNPDSATLDELVSFLGIARSD